MLSGARGSNPPGPPKCPSCQSSDVVRTHEQMGEQLYFCPNCEKTWGVRPGVPKAVNKLK